MGYSPIVYDCIQANKRNPNGEILPAPPIIGIIARRVRVGAKK